MRMPSVVLIALVVGSGRTEGQPTISTAEYRGWKTTRLGNGLIELDVVPEIGGRVVQFRLGTKEFLWVNPALAGKLPPAGGLGPDGTWLNYGGDKLWPAPQGWENEEQWPGPPDAVLDGRPYRLEVRATDASLRLTSGDDPRSGIRFSRLIRMFRDSTRVSVDATMTNVDTKPRRWGIWAHTQLDGASPTGSGHNSLLNAWCPLRPGSQFPEGYRVIFGEKDNPSFQPDPAHGLLRVTYQYRVGKVGLDSHAGWVATVDGATGAVFVQRFVFEASREYPDGASVEFWLNGRGTIHAYNQEMTMPDDPADNPYVFESEVLSPFARLQPGESYTWHYDWYATNVGGDHPVLDCTDVAVTAEPLMATVADDGADDAVRLRGRFGVLEPGSVRAVFLSAEGLALKTLEIDARATPLSAVVVDASTNLPAPTAFIALELYDRQGQRRGEIARVAVGDGVSLRRWPAGRAWAWYGEQPWLVGCNYLPASSINSTEMWQAATFDPETIDQELKLAGELGFNCARVFLQYLVWEADPRGTLERLDRFLSIAQKHGIRTMPVLFDDCAFSTMTEPFLGKQPPVIPGEYANGWTPSPGPLRVQDRSAWPRLARYVREVIGCFAKDPRVLLWDLYNEPTNGTGAKSLPLLRVLFDWARQAGPTQPLTVGTWGGHPEVRKIAVERSDVLSFHSYGRAPDLEKMIEDLEQHARPLICTEWLNRPRGSLVATCLPVFARHRVGCLHWGLVNGKTQTHYPWGSRAGAPLPEVWQHDIFRRDRTPYDADELELFRRAIARDGRGETSVKGRWSRQKAWAWYGKSPWLVGCNYLPSTAVNDVEMWDESTFDPETIDRELEWAAGLGFNSVRVFVNYVTWKDDPEGLRERFARFLSIADRHGISTMPILFDDCNFSGNVAQAGKQAEPVPGVHNSGWVSSPPHAYHGRPETWGDLKRYVYDIVGSFGQDRRVVIWDLYNEPSRCLPLAEAAFRWAREAKPTQPLTTCVFGPADFRARILELSDVINFHDYGPLASAKSTILSLVAHGRPVICSEWMARTRGSRFESVLPFFKENGIACWNWGLVAGRTQTYYPWGSPRGAPEPTLWFHDIFRRDGSPFSALEVRFIRGTTGVRPPLSTRPLVPTSATGPAEWRYVLQAPADDWFQPNFDDRDWKRGPAPFGREEAPFARRPHTVWTSSDIWLRREFELPPGELGPLWFTLYHDEDTDLYLNGVLAARVPGYNAAYETVEILAPALATLKPGKNTIAAHCRHTGGGQYFDVGIVGITAE